MISLLDSVFGIPVFFATNCGRVAQATGFWPFRKKILVGLQWFYLSPEEQYAVLLHEVGHCKAFHMEKRILYIPLVIFPSLLKALCRQQELEADEFVVKNGHGEAFSKALDRMKKINFNEDYGLYPTIEERISRINSKLLTV